MEDNKIKHNINSFICNLVIMLEPFEYGFIGGASGIVDGKIAFCGNIRLHKDYHKIKSFCDIHNVEILNLSDSISVDVGTIIMLG